MKVKKVAVAAAALAVGTGAVLLTATNAFAAPLAPKRVQVARDATDAGKVGISWAAADGATRYNVSVFDGKNDSVSTVYAPATRLDLNRAEPCTRLRVNVSSRDTSGKGGTSSNAWLNTAAPGGISQLKAKRDATRTELTATWRAPGWWGAGNGTGDYKVQLISLPDKTVVYENVVTDPTVTVPHLDAKTEYQLSVTPENAFGSCFTSKLLILDGVPTMPTGARAVQDKSDKRKITVSWNAPAYTGDSPITSYLVGYNRLESPEVQSVRTSADETSHTFDLSADYDYSFWVLAYNGQGEGRTAVGLKVINSRRPQLMRPSVLISATSGGQVSVKLSNPVGYWIERPNVLVRLRPAGDADGFVDEQYGQPGANTITMAGVPAGTYEVVVSGTNETSAEEWATQTVSVGDAAPVPVPAARPMSWITTGLTTNDWTSSTLLNKVPLATSDVTLNTTVKEKNYNDYGFYVRASVNPNLPYNPITGYRVHLGARTVKVPSAAHPDAHTSYYGFEIIEVHDDKPCATPLVFQAAPVNVNTTGDHLVNLAVRGDTLTLLVDGNYALRVPSLSAAHAAACGGSAEPTGRQAGPQLLAGQGLAQFPGITIS